MQSYFHVEKVLECLSCYITIPTYYLLYYYYNKQHAKKQNKGIIEICFQIIFQKKMYFYWALFFTLNILLFFWCSIPIHVTLFNNWHLLLKIPMVHYQPLLKVKVFPPPFFFILKLVSGFKFFWFGYSWLVNVTNTV